MAVSFSTSGTASAGGVQQSYALVHAALLEGQLSDIRDNTIGTYINETAVVQPFGDLQVYNLAGTVAHSAKVQWLFMLLAPSPLLQPSACFIAQAALARLVNSAMPSLRAKLFVSPTLVSFPLPLVAVWRSWN